LKKVFFKTNDYEVGISLPLIPKYNFRNAPNKNYIELSSKKLSKCHTRDIWNRP